MNRPIFMVEMGNVHFICHAYDREDAKRLAHDWMGGDMEKYTITPLTEMGDRVHISLTLFV